MTKKHNDEYIEKFKGNNYYSRENKKLHEKRIY